MPHLDLSAGSPASRAIALAAAGAMLLLLWAGLIAPLLDWSMDSGRIAEMTRQLAVQRRIAERKPALEAELAALRATPPDLTDFLPGATPAVAAADLQSRLGVLIHTLGGTLTSAESYSLPDQGGFRRAGLRLKLSLRESGLAPLLSAIETQQPRLFLSALSIRAARDDQLILAVDLFGYLPAETP